MGLGKWGTLPFFAVGPPRGYRFEEQARIFSSIRKSDGLFWNIVKPEDFGFIDWMRLLFLTALFIVLTFSDSFAGAGWVLQKFNPV